MEFPCWLCTYEFEKKRFLKTHIGNSPHCRLKVVCPWCTAFMVTANRTSDLRKHVVRAHPRVLEGLPSDFFSETNGYYLALYPEDYKRVCITGHPSSEVKAIIIELITKLNEVMSKPPKSMEEWREQWDVVLVTEPISPRTKTSTHATQSSAQQPPQAVGTSNRVPSKPMPLAEPSDELLGTRSWVNTISSSRTQFKSKTMQDTPAVTSTLPSVSVSHVASTVLTPPRTPTSAMSPAGSSSRPEVTSVLNHSGNHLAQGEGGQATAAAGKSRTHSCGICGRYFPGIKNLRNHRKVHLAEMPYRCLQCGKRFFYQPRYSYHMRKVHGSGKTNKPTEHACAVCKCFPSKEKLRIHQQQYKHSVGVSKKSKETLFTRNTGSSTIKAKSTLDAHKQIRDCPRLPCPLCKKVFPRISHLKCHVFQVHRTSLFDLAMKGDQKAKLLMKIKQHFPKPYECELCGNRFETIEGKRKHMEIHEKENNGDSNNPRDYSIEKPSSTTNTANNNANTVRDNKQMQACIADVMDSESRHSSTSSGDNSNSATAQKPQSELEDHIFKRGTLYESRFIQKKRRNYNCDICGARYQLRRNLARHVKTHIDGPVKAATQARSRYFTGHIPYRNRSGYAKMGINADDVRMETLGEEVKENENGTTKYRCKVCLATFNRHSGLMDHITLQADYHCHHFTKKLSKLIYSSLSDSDLKRYICCDLCGLFYSSRQSFNRHFEKHRRRIAAGEEINRFNIQNTETESQTREEDRPDDESPGYNFTEAFNLDHNYAGTIGPQIEIVRDDIEMDIPPDSIENAENQNIQEFENREDGETARPHALTPIKQEGSWETTSFEQSQVNVSDIGLMESDLNQNIAIQLHDKDSEKRQIKSNFTVTGVENNENNIVIEKVESFADRQCIESTENVAHNSTLEYLKEPTKDKTKYNVIDLDESCNDYNSSDEDILFEENVVSRDKGTQQDLPMGTNKECIQCQIPFVERHVTITCHLCCKRFCRPCSQIPRQVFREAFRGPSVGLVWMCKVCKPAFPKYMGLLHQLAQFEDVLNNRLTNISKRLTAAEHSSVEDGSNGLKKHGAR